MRLCGHRTRAVFDRYSVVNEEWLREGVEKLARLRSEAGPERAVVGLRHRSGTISAPRPDGVGNVELRNAK